jgi:glycosyltransferase involved in cell wall biosynthesis
MIAAVICTIQGREAMLKRALACVEAQTGVDVYPLIVADYEHDQGGILVAPGESYAKRLNIAAKLTKAEWIAHFDDDDISAPGRLAYQLANIGDYAVCGFNRITIEDADSGDLWHYHGPENYGAGASLLYRREYALRYPFETAVPNEDLYFTAQAAQRGDFIALDGREYLTATKHPGNTLLEIRGKEFTYAGRKTNPPDRDPIADRNHG